MPFLKAGRRYFLLECLKVDIPIKLYKEVFNVIFFIKRKIRTSCKQLWPPLGTGHRVHGGGGGWGVWAIKNCFLNTGVQWAIPEILEKIRAAHPWSDTEKLSSPPRMIFTASCQLRHC